MINTITDCNCRVAKISHQRDTPEDRKHQHIHNTEKSKMCLKKSINKEEKPKSEKKT